MTAPKKPGGIFLRVLYSLKTGQSRVDEVPPFPIQLPAERAASEAAALVERLREPPSKP